MLASVNKAVILAFFALLSFAVVSAVNEVRPPTKLEDIYVSEPCTQTVQANDHLQTEFIVEFQNKTQGISIVAPQQYYVFMDSSNESPLQNMMLGMCRNSTRRFTWNSGNSLSMSPFPPKFAANTFQDEEVSLIVRVVHITSDSDFAIFSALNSANFSQVFDLIEEHRGINAVDQWGQSPLIISVINKYNQVTALLLNARNPKVNVNFAKSSGFTALFYAVQKGSNDITQALLRRGADPNVALLEEGSRGNTPLHIACFLEKYKQAELLLQFGAHPFATNEFGLTPLQMIPRDAVRSTKMYFKKIFDDAFDKSQQNNQRKTVEVSGN